MKEYLDAVEHVLETGTLKANRTGIDTVSTFGHSYRVDLRKGFPLLTTKKMNWKNIVVELMWMLRGDKDIDFLHRHRCRFWDSWADEYGIVPSAYGHFWRNYPSYALSGPVDQIAWAVKELSTNPMNRRICVTAWSPPNATKSSLPPCHAFFVFNVQIENGKNILCCHMTQRSCDMALGVPYDIALYALLMKLFERFTGIEAAYFHHTLVDAHIYTGLGDNLKYCHKAGLSEQLDREPRTLPQVEITDRINTLDDLDTFLRASGDWSTDSLMRAFRLINYDPHPAISFKVAV